MSTYGLRLPQQREAQLGRSSLVHDQLHRPTWVHAPIQALPGKLGRRLRALLGGRVGDDLRAQLVVGREAAMVPKDRVARWEHQRRQAREQLVGRHDDVRGALALVLALIGGMPYRRHVGHEIS
jgi:hypothetical protein